jgi:transglutaminase-like putative cysteine protease
MLTIVQYDVSMGKALKHRNAMFLFAIVAVSPLLVLADAELKSPVNAKDTSRQFEFTYETTVTGLKPGELASIWLPVAETNADQKVTLASETLPMAKTRRTREPRYGNEILFLEGKSDAEGKILVRLVYKVTRYEVKSAQPGKVTESAELVDRFLKPDVKVPITGKPLELIKDKDVPKDPLEAARLFYDVVNGHMRYSKEGAGWGEGDSVWACGSKYGNCTDFHSLFTSLARANKIPTKFEIGFPLPARHGEGKIGSYHCWAKFLVAGKGWVPVDISEANKDPKLKDYYFGNLTPDRIGFSVGRDIDLVPRQAGPPLNYFVYPYVEVDGKVYPRANIINAFSFKDTK